MSQVANERLSYVSNLYEEEDKSRELLMQKITEAGGIELHYRGEMRLPIEKYYFTGEMLSNYEPCSDALQAVIDAEGEDDDAWNAFENYIEKFMDFSWCSKWDGKRYDLVLYGVSGYTGYLTMQYLLRAAFKRTPEPFTVAFAGRTASKVVAMRDRNFTGTQWADIPVLSATYDDPMTMMDLAKSARAIINVAGPYMLNPGELLIDSCCWSGTHYFDINGEIPWMLRCCELHQRAIDGDVMICPAAAVAGCYPQILTELLFQKIQEEYGDKEELKDVCCLCNAGGTGGGSSGGTLATRFAMSSASDEVRKAMADPYALGGFIPDRDASGIKLFTIKAGTGEVTMKTRKTDADAYLSKLQEDKANGFWKAPHVYAFFDTRMARRTNAILADMLGKPWGTNLTWTEFFMVMPEYLEVMQAANAGSKGAAGEKEALEAAGKYYKQGEGPALEDLGDAFIGFNVIAETVNGIIAKNGGCGGDGYFETARCAIECALASVFDRDECPIKGGCLPANCCVAKPAMGRMINAGFKFEANRWLNQDEWVPPDINKTD
mmetsp:Transcript_69182/g.130396  ORF Transcript_69182/g.130396 Transcript_69182/m.130396 type:complete len:549 (-) Transcript_69182:109-1755(-)